MFQQSQAPACRGGRSTLAKPYLLDALALGTLGTAQRWCYTEIRIQWSMCGELLVHTIYYMHGCDHTATHSYYVRPDADGSRGGRRAGCTHI